MVTAEEWMLLKDPTGESTVILCDKGTVTSYRKRFPASKVCTWTDMERVRYGSHTLLLVMDLPHKTAVLDRLLYGFPQVPHRVFLVFARTYSSVVLEDAVNTGFPSDLRKRYDPSVPEL